MKILENEPLLKYCAYRTGGRAKYLALPGNKTELADLLSWAKARAEAFEIFGYGANLLISDDGYDGLAISLREFEKYCVRNGNAVIVGAGVLLSDAVKYICEEGLAGAANLAGIPGSMGGALKMNAGAFGTEIKDIIARANALSLEDLTEEMLSIDELRLSYRASAGLEGKIVLAAELALKEGDKAELMRERSDILKRRAEKQPLEYPSCGSVFKHTEQGPAGKLIEECGLKGKRAGGAEISEKHANFIVNKGNAVSKDIMELINLAKASVYEKFGVHLETEVRFLGEF
jgi:UDP-N-acetylmuramate dehydrogenase